MRNDNQDFEEFAIKEYICPECKERFSDIRDFKKHYESCVIRKRINIEKEFSQYFSSMSLKNRLELLKDYLNGPELSELLIRLLFFAATDTKEERKEELKNVKDYANKKIKQKKKRLMTAKQLARFRKLYKIHMIRNSGIDFDKKNWKHKVNELYGNSSGVRFVKQHMPKFCKEHRLF